MAKFYEPKKLGSIGTSFARDPLHALSTVAATASLGLLGNPKGNPVSRGDVPALPKALPPTAQLPNVPFLSAGAGAGRRRGRRGNGTILTGSRGLQSGTAGNTILGA